MLITYIIGINILLFLAMGIDKYNSIHNLWRIPEKSIFLLAFLGGSIGGILGMILFHHKTKKWYFKLLFTIVLLINIYLYYKIK